MKLQINPGDQKTFGPCECCGNLTRRIWGYVYELETPLATYFVEWTPGHDEQDAYWDLIIGKWGEDTGPEDRVAVALAYRVLESGPSFMVIDAATRRLATGALASRALQREEVIGTELAQTVFGIVDEVFLHDPRLNTLPGTPGYLAPAPVDY
ncbi:MAG TPA: hypothetical protein VKX25_19820 [Bryobacteraceae bacterium]|nr:hypothetical protein [Bryobacteraceae bacterium]